MRYLTYCEPGDCVGRNAAKRIVLRCPGGDHTGDRAYRVIKYCVRYFVEAKAAQGYEVMHICHFRFFAEPASIAAQFQHV